MSKNSFQVPKIVPICYLRFVVMKYTKLLKVFGYMIILYGILNLSAIVKDHLQLSKKFAAKSSTTYEISFANFTQHYKYILLPSSSTLSSCLRNGGRIDDLQRHEKRQEDLHQLHSIVLQIRISPLMIATVLSTANHTEERQAVRETWASERESKFIKTHYVMVFFIISSTSKNDLHNLQKEQEEYDDLIVTDLHEGFRNLHLKVYASMVFLQQYCPSAHFLMKVDDDVALNLDRVVDSWKRDSESIRSIFCRVWIKMPPIRNINSKYYVPENAWPNEYFPPYCSGPMYIMGKEAIQLILDYAPLFTPVTVDDVFYTGIIAEKAKIQRVHWEASVTFDFQKFSLECNKPKEVKLFVHSLHSPTRLRTVFQLMRNSKRNYDNDTIRICIVCLLILALFCACY
ncbi:unnamed protein product [Cylicocyclus nassatus]|uniref:Hexosyltransferase n=1 Tax=Cylicocyclus nassatus TaxID=53992 RepID=A0AA36M9S1_CYLNA|nr:unnamed protein product [Cylicocyclus nassatus]